MFFRKVITIPAAGVDLIVDVGGCAVTVEQMDLYSDPEQQPLLFLDGDETGAPLYNQSTYIPVGCERFSRIRIQGTAESAGGSLYLLISDVSMRQQISPEVARRVMPGISFAKVAADPVQTLSNVELSVGGRLGSAMYISNDTASGAPLAYAFNVDPDQAGFAHVLLAGEILKIEGIAFMQAFRFRSRTAGTPVAITITVEL